MLSERDAYEVLQVHPKADQRVVQAAYRVLAALYHPDRDGSDIGTRRMAGLNDAYAKVRTPDRRAVYDRAQQRQRAEPPPIAASYRPAPRSKPGGSGGTLDFGRYAGWTIAQLAHENPDYLRWLSRHSSGLRFRTEIEAVLPKPPAPTESPRERGRQRRRA